MTIPAQAIPHRLLEPLQLGRMTLRNRVIMAPMTRCRAVDINVPSELAIEYYGQRASAGLIITEATQVSEGAQGYWRTPGLHNERQCVVWRRVVERIHAEGGRIFVQLWHNGRVFHPDNVAPGRWSVAPSAIAPNTKLITPNGLRVPPIPRALDADGIAAISADFVLAAQRAVACGFDGVELHAANGYLFDQFLHASSNQRTDRWGGSIENRSRFLLDTVAAVCRAIGADRTAVRISPLGSFNDVHDPQPQAIYRYVVSRLAEQNLCYLHVIRPQVSGTKTIADHVSDLLPDIRALYPSTLLVAGDLDVATADHLVDAGLADGVGFGRWFIGNPDLPERLQHGWPLVDAPRSAYYADGQQGYTDFPCHAAVSEPSSAIKVVYCIRRRADLSPEAFQRYWKEVHAPMLLERAASMRLTAYVQTSPIQNAYSERVERPGVLELPFDGIAELYWANEQDMQHGFESAEALTLQRQLAQDEPNFIDPARSARWIARETAPIPRSSI